MPSPSPQATIADPRWPQVLARDKAADGSFWYSVVTTGVYCRPSCPSRAADPANVSLHATLAEAQATGFRACKRCNPDGPAGDAERTALIGRVCRLIEASETPPSLAELAAAVARSPGHLHRLFKAETGVTPKAYGAAHRARRLHALLPASDSVTAAVHEAGFGSTGRFHDHAAGLLGMTPTAYRAGGVGERLRFAIGRCSLGAVLVASSAIGVAAILLGDDPEALARDLQDRFPRATLIGDDTGYDAVIARVIAMVETPAVGLDLPLDIRGTAFQQRVWQALRAIPVGKTASYREIAGRIGSPAAVRAVASACAANTLAVAIPCHRVIRTDGSASGYAWGVARKQALIARERS